MVEQEQAQAGGVALLISVLLSPGNVLVAVTRIAPSSHQDLLLFSSSATACKQLAMHTG